jgi:hypothetical protein
MTRLFGLFRHAHDEKIEMLTLLRTMQKGGLRCVAFGPAVGTSTEGHVGKFFTPKPKGPGGLINPEDNSYWRAKAGSPAANSQNPHFPMGSAKKKIR